MQWSPKIAGGLHWREDGDPDGRPILFLNSLGTDLRMWECLLPLLPERYRLLRMDTRGHGLSSLPEGPSTLDTLMSDAAALLDHADARDAIIVGISLGGMMAMSLALSRPECVSGLVILNSAARMGSHDMWQSRMDAIKRGGLDHIADGVLERWFSEAFRAGPEATLWRNLLSRTPEAGYLACCEVLAAADITDAVASIQCPCLVIAGSEDRASPTDVVRATAERIPHADFHVIDGVGHLPPIEAPDATAGLINAFLADL